MKPDLRELVRYALEKASAYRTAPLAKDCAMKAAILTSDLAKVIVDKFEPDRDPLKTAVQLGELAKEPGMRKYVNFIGGHAADPWNNYEWSLPPDELVE